MPCALPAGQDGRELIKPGQPRLVPITGAKYGLTPVLEGDFKPRQSGEHRVLRVKTVYPADA